MTNFKATFDTDATFKAKFSTDANFNAKFGNVQVIPTGDYNDLANKPSIESHVLQGDSTIEQIGVGTLTVQEIEKILYLD